VIPGAGNLCSRLYLQRQRADHENPDRNAGFSDVPRFTRRMETLKIGSVKE
jgi:hypothetical protein